MLRNLFAIAGCFLWAACSPAKSKAQKTSSTASVKTILEFGAIPNDGKDDTWAFIKAGKYFSNLWDINGVPLKKGNLNFSYGSDAARLEIPSGTYHVGRQIKVPETGLNTTYGEIFGFKAASATIQRPAKSAFKFGLEIIQLSNPANNINGITIKGTGKTRPVIRYNDGITLGYFDSKGIPLKLTDDTYNSGKWAITIGNFISAEHVKNLQIENIEVDGNNRSTGLGGKTNYGGGYSIHMIQMGGSGAYLLDTKNVTVKNVSFNYMTLDGIVVQDYYKDPSKFSNQPLTNVIIDSSNFNYNRRQGFSWVGGRSITVTNSTFNFTGSTVEGIAVGNPGAGVDIEPEQDDQGNMLWCLDGNFKECQFVDNYGCALLNDATASRTKNLNFTNSVFHDVQGYSVWVKGAGITFRDCKIWGGFVYGNAGKTKEDATKFYNCDFADEELPYKNGKHNEGYALVESWQTSSQMYFDNCRFRVLHPKQRMFAIYNLGSKETDFFNFTNCRFSFQQKANSNENIIFGAVFSGNTQFENLNKQESIVVAMNGIVFTGSDNAAKPSIFSSVGKLMLFPANTNGKNLKQFVLGRSQLGSEKTDGHLRFNVGSESCLYGYWDQTIDIGINTVFTNSAGGQLAILSGNINNAGKIVLEDGSYTAFFNPLSINTKQKGEFYFMPSAKQGVNATWKKALDGLGNGMGIQHMKFSPNTKIKGGNKAVPPERVAK